MAQGIQADDPIPAINVAGMILIAAQEGGIGALHPKKLQKLLYFVQLYHLGLYQKPAFTDTLKAWRDGPVVPGVRYEYMSPMSLDVTSIKNPDHIRVVIRSKPSIYECVTKVIEDFGGFSWHELADFTHGQRPWLDAWKGDPGRSEPIPLESLRSFASVLLRHTRPGAETKNLDEQIQALLNASGDWEFVRAKAELADAAGKLNYALSASDLDGAKERARARLAEILRIFLERYQGRLPISVPLNSPSSLDEFARMLTSKAMTLRGR
jgi:uncharacterized phage-associated protein